MTKQIISTNKALLLIESYLQGVLVGKLKKESLVEIEVIDTIE